MRLRFVTCQDDVSKLIRMREGLVPKWLSFCPSHVELAGFDTDQGTPGYLGAHYDGGIAIRPVGYDQAKLLGELFVDVPLTAAGELAARAFAQQKLGAPYDWKAIIEFLIPVALHDAQHFICSAFATIVLAHGQFFPGRLAKEPHTTSPLDLLFLLSGRLAISA